MTVMAGDAAAERARCHVMFVDDDQYLLDGLRDALRPSRHRWEMSFVTSGSDALAVLAGTPADVLISDLRMPGLDGAALLEIVRDRFPSTVRVVLSGHADIRLVARAAAVAHRLIPKPCETEELVLVVERSCALKEIAGRIELDRRAIGASVLPSVPYLYAELTEALASGSASASDIGHIIGQDIAMTAKVLQLANSAYFGRRSPITNIAEAVAYLGIETVRSLVLHAEAFREFRVDAVIPGFDLDRLHQHCTQVAQLASAVLKDAGGVGDAMTAGLLHDLGLLVLASQDPDGLASILSLASKQRRSIQDIELEQHGITHAEIGAHVLALWGVPHTVTEAVAGHHDSSWLTLPFDAVAAVHVADTLVTELEAASDQSAPPPAELDLEYLERAGLASRVTRWRELAADQAAGDGTKQ